MNDTTLKELENNRIEKLKKFKLDSNSILEFQSKINKVTAEESDKLGKELLDTIKKMMRRNPNSDLTKRAINLILSGANIEYKDEKKGDFPLLTCIRKENTELAYALLRAGANINQVNNYLTTATMAAARHGQKNILELLILLGADMNAKCLDGDNALMSAKRHNQQECFDLLVKSQTYLNHRNIENKTIDDIPGNITFKSKKIDDLSTMMKTEEDAINLIEEAENKLNIFNESIKKILNHK